MEQDVLLCNDSNERFVIKIFPFNKCGKTSYRGKLRVGKRIKD